MIEGKEDIPPLTLPPPSLLQVTCSSCGGCINEWDKVHYRVARTQPFQDDIKLESGLGFNTGEGDVFDQDNNFTLVVSQYFEYIDALYDDDEYGDIIIVDPYCMMCDF